MAPKLPQRTLGKNGPQVPAIGVGLMGLSAAYTTKPAPDAERLAFLDAALALGCMHWDSADIYGDSEDLLGQWFQKTGKRDDVCLSISLSVSLCFVVLLC